MVILLYGTSRPTLSHSKPLPHCLGSPHLRVGGTTSNQTSSQIWSPTAHDGGFAVLTMTLPSTLRQRWLVGEGEQNANLRCSDFRSSDGGWLFRNTRCGGGWFRTAMPPLKHRGKNNASMSRMDFS